MARFNCWCAIGLVLLFNNIAFADSYSIGPNGINSAGLGLTGAGVRIGQVERGRPGDADNGDTAGNRNSTTNPFDVFIQNNPGNPMPDAEVRPHAQEVAGVMISTSTDDGTAPPAIVNGIAPTGVAPGASLYSSAYVTTDVNPGYDDAILTFQFIATIPNMRAVNHSWGKEEADYHTNPLNGESKLTMALDWSAYWHDVLHIVSGNQGNMIPVPKDNYNGMTIGRSAKAADGVYRLVSGGNTFDEDAFGDRTSISLLAPGDGIEVASVGDAHRIVNGSSYAAPHVTGTVALLLQNSSTAHQRRHGVMKVVLMNSTDKIKGIMGMERTVVKTGGEAWRSISAPAD
jgi:subtilisin family serine protease